MMRLQSAISCFAMPLAFACLAPLASCGDDRIGVVAEKPSAGRFVKVDQAYLIPYTKKIPGTEVTFEMIPIPAGEFLQGSPLDEAGRNDDEGPQRRVAVSAFWIGRYEVTWAEYLNYMQLCTVFEKFDDLGVRQLTTDNKLDAITAPSKLYDPSFTFASGEAVELPAVSMSQYAAKQYTKWLSLLTGEVYRLPTEAEWEYACRAGAKTAYGFGSGDRGINDYAWHADNAEDVAHPVGQKKPNAWDLFDMHGNASEWVLDGYAPDAYATTLEATGYHPAEKLYPRVLRGGSFLSEPSDCRSAARQASDDEELRAYDPNTPKSPWWFASDEAQAIGFRIVRPWPSVAESERPKYWEADLTRIQKIADFRIDEEGRGERGVVDPELPAAIEDLRTAGTEGTSER